MLSNPPRVPLSHLGVPLSRSGVLLNHLGVPLSHSGVPLNHLGVPLSRSGMPLSYLGMPLSHLGVPLGHSGVLHLGKLGGKIGRGVKSPAAMSSYKLTTSSGATTGGNPNHIVGGYNARTNHLQ